MSNYVRAVEIAFQLAMRCPTNLVKLLEESYDGPRHFDAHSYRSENEEGVWEFAAGRMRNYLILKETVDILFGVR